MQCTPPSHIRQRAITARPCQMRTEAYTYFQKTDANIKDQAPTAAPCLEQQTTCRTSSVSA
jgi:hypothetical protein